MRAHAIRRFIRLRIYAFCVRMRIIIIRTVKRLRCCWAVHLFYPRSLFKAIKTNSFAFTLFFLFPVSAMTKCKAISEREREKSRLIYGPLTFWTWGFIGSEEKESEQCMFDSFLRFPRNLFLCIFKTGLPFFASHFKVIFVPLGCLRWLEQNSRMNNFCWCQNLTPKLRKLLFRIVDFSHSL